MAALACDTAEDCDDGDVCTTNACIENTCVFTTLDGCIDCETAEDCADGNDCTADLCNDPGGCDNPNAPQDTPCGDASDAECNLPDTCDGNGNCIDNVKAEATLCREAAGECDVAEACTGLDPDCPPDEFAPAGSACGDPADGDCDNPDSCDGAGLCLENHAADDTSCDDTLFCTLTDSCQAGVCVGSGDPCAADEKCDEAEDACGPAATLVVHDLIVAPGQMGDLLVSGSVANQGTFGVTILVELVPRPGNMGTVLFTPAPPVDVFQAGDAWPDAGIFSPFDTDSKGFSGTLNGAIDDSGALFCDGSLEFEGPLAGFPVFASGDAEGVWDAVLVTASGDSGWECVPTTLMSGTITVGAVAVAPVDIRPGACPNPVNIRSRGVLPTAIVGTADFDVSLIDVDSLTLSRADGVGGSVQPMLDRGGPEVVIQDVSAPALNEDVCACDSPTRPDGFDDLLVRFSVAELVEALELSGMNRDSQPLLMLEGTLLDGTRFSGSDCIRILGPQIRRD